MSSTQWNLRSQSVASISWLWSVLMTWNCLWNQLLTTPLRSESALSLKNPIVPRHMLTQRCVCIIIYSMIVIWGVVLKCHEHWPNASRHSAWPLGHWSGLFNRLNVERWYISRLYCLSALLPRGSVAPYSDVWVCKIWARAIQLCNPTLCSGTDITPNLEALHSYLAGNHASKRGHVYKLRGNTWMRLDHSTTGV